VGWYAENNSQLMQDGTGEARGYKVAAWSSSGVMRPLEEFWGFDESIYQQLVKSGVDCVQLAQALTKDVERALVANGTERDQVLSILKASPTATTGDVLFYTADALALTVQYGNRTGLCKMLQSVQNEPLDEKLEALKKTAKFAKMRDYDRTQMLTNMSTNVNNSMR